MKNEHGETLTVLVVTRNHQDHIAQAIESVRMQRGIVIDRLVVSDDCSTDRTVEVANEVIARHGMTAEVIESPRRLGIAPHYQKLFASVETELVAVLEGDDYWFDILKLSRQLSLLHTYPYTSACALGYMHYHQTTKNFEGRSFGEGAISILGTEDIVNGEDGFGFSNMVYRTDVLRRIPSEFYLLKSYDWITNILVSREAPIIRLDIPGFVHRVTSAGAYAGLGLVGQLETFIECVESYLPYSDEYTAGLLEARLVLAKATLEHVRAPEPEPAPAPEPPPVTRRMKSAIKRLIGK